MKLSNFYLKTRKDVSADIVSASHRLMLRSGMVKQLSSGLYAWLPAGLRVLRKIENIIREEMDRSGFAELLMPTLQPADLWHESQRYETYGQEMLKITDRHGSGLVYGPTAEEAVVAIVRDQLSSYKELPCTLYNIQWKFRDEIRPRFGVMRAREFLMLDSYSFDETEDGAVETYYRHFDTFFRIFSRMGLVTLATEAETGEIGGNLSHEFHVIADSGESEIIFDSALSKFVSRAINPELASDLRHKISEHYASTVEKHEANRSVTPPGVKLTSKRGIEVGHIFHFGQKYSSTMGFTVTGKDGVDTHPFMGSYGIGIARLVAAFIEANHDDNGIIWNKVINPFYCVIMNLSKSDESAELLEKLKSLLQSANLDYLEDNSDDSFGIRASRADLLGSPFRVIISNKSISSDNGVEVKNRRTREIIVCNLENLLTVLLDTSV